MNSAASVSSLTIPLVSGYGLGILRVSSDQEPLTEALTTLYRKIDKFVQDLFTMFIGNDDDARVVL